MSRAILGARGLHKRYGGVHALRGAHFSVCPGEVHALAGENGSGKSTLLKILAGQVGQDAGEITFRGQDVVFRGAIDALRRGIATVTQETTLVPDLTVAENIFLGHRMAKRSGVIDWRATHELAHEALDRLAVDISPWELARRLRPDHQQIVEIARALSFNARVLILDEPTSSLTQDEVDSLFRTVEQLREHGVAVIFVSHRLDEVFAIADRITVLRDGRTVSTGLAEKFTPASLVELVVGRPIELNDAGGEDAVETEPVLRVRGLSQKDVLAPIDFDLAPGEIVGLAGLVGAGRRELLEALFGLRPAEGSIELGGKQVAYRHPRHAIRDGVGFVPAERKLQGLVLQMSIRENLMMARTSLTPRFGVPNSRREQSTVRDQIEGLGIRAHSPTAPVSTLSGGNQQKVVLGKWLFNDLRLLLLDEPTRGVDVGAKAEIYRLLRDAAHRGAAILVSSSENDELLALCHRILVMFRGRVAATFDAARASEARIAHFAGGSR